MRVRPPDSSPPLSQARHDGDHLERALHRLAALVARPGGRALERLLESVHRQNDKAHRYPGLEPGELQAVRRLTGDVFEVRRVAADHAAECDHGIVATARGESAHHHWQLEGAGYAHHGEILCGATALVPGSARALEEARDDEVVEARSDDRHAPPTRAHFAFDCVGGTHPSSPT